MLYDPGDRRPQEVITYYCGAAWRGLLDTNKWGFCDCIAMLEILLENRDL